MGSMTSSTAPRKGENTLFAPDVTPEVMPCVRPLRSSEMIERDNTPSTTTVSVRRDRRDLGTPWRPGDPSACGRGDQHPFERFELFEALSGADRHTVQRVPGHPDGKAALALHPRLEAVEHAAPAGEHDALFHDVGRQCRRRAVERDLDGVDDGGDRLLYGAPDLLGGDHD